MIREGDKINAHRSSMGRYLRYVYVLRSLYTTASGIQNGKRQVGCVGSGGSMGGPRCPLESWNPPSCGVGVG